MGSKTVAKPTDSVLTFLFSITELGFKNCEVVNVLDSQTVRLSSW